MAQAGTEETIEVVDGAQLPEDETTLQPTGDQPTGNEGGDELEAGDEDEVVVSIGGESPPPEEEDESRAPEWVRELRKSNREKDRKLREQEAEITRLRGTGQAPAAVVVGEKPTLEGCNYDAASFETKLEAWHTRKREADAQQAEAEAKQKKQADAWQATQQEYLAEKASLKVRDYGDAEEVVRATLSVTQQGILLDAVDKGRRAVVVYALGKNPKKAQELAAIENPIKFTAALTKLEMQLKVTPKKTAPPPERMVRSSVPGSAAIDNQLEKLRAEAAKTGDLSKVLAFKAQQRAGGR